jgi:hypothetical protein
MHVQEMEIVLQTMFANVNPDS